MATKAIIGSRCKLRRGNADSVTTAVRASRTMGSSSSGLIIYWGVGGTAGNAKTCSIVVSGNNTPLTVNVTSSAVTVNAATNGSGTATSTVNQIIEALYANSTFRASWDARPVTDGTGTISAATSASLSGGVDGETFTAIAEVKGLRGPGLAGATTEVTSFDSNGVREHMPTLRDGGSLSFTVNYIPNASGTGHQALAGDLEDGLVRNFEIEFTDPLTTVISLSGIVTGFEVTAELEQAVTANVTIKVTGWPTWF